MIHSHRLSDLRVDADFPIPGWERWDGPAGHAADVTVGRGSLPDHLPDPDFRGPIQEAKGRELYLLRLPTLGRYLLRAGREIMVDADPSADLREVLLHVTGSLQAILWYQRGRIPVHGSVVELEGRNVALVGPTACGKSTLAGWLHRQGCPILADEICLLELPDGQPPVRLFAVSPHLQLWGRALDGLGIPGEGLVRLLADREKYLLPTPGLSAPDASRTLSALVSLRRGTGHHGVPSLDRLRGMAAFHAVFEEFHHPRVARGMGLGKWMFATAGAVANHVPVYNLGQPMDFGQLPAIAGLLRALVKGGE